MKIFPCPNQVCVQVETKKKKTKNGIVVPGDKEFSSEMGTVIAVGEGVFNIQPRDKILFKGYSLSEAKIDEDTHYSFLDFELILAKVVE